MNIGYNPVDGTEDESGRDYSMDYSPHNRSIVPSTFSNDEVLSRFSRYKLPADGSFLPEKMEIRERSTRREKEDMRRLFLLGKDRVHYKIIKFGKLGVVAGEPDEDVSML